MSRLRVFSGDYFAIVTNPGDEPDVLIGADRRDSETLLSIPLPVLLDLVEKIRTGWRLPPTIAECLVLPSTGRILPCGHPLPCPFHSPCTNDDHHSRVYDYVAGRATCEDCGTVWAIPQKVS